MVSCGDVNVCGGCWCGSWGGMGGGNDAEGGESGGKAGGGECKGSEKYCGARGEGGDGKDGSCRT